LAAASFKVMNFPFDAIFIQTQVTIFNFAKYFELEAIFMVEVWTLSNHFDSSYGL
jgi:hypothetical protein